VAEAARKGAVAVVMARTKLQGGFNGCAVIAVEETRKALGDLAAAYRRDFSLPMAAVAGSNGKTTTKELAASVLRQKFAVLWSEASFNNDIGVPLTLLNLENSHGVAVLEIGTNHPGELAPLVQMVQPNYGIITSIGREHLEFFGDVPGVAREQGTLAELLPEQGKLFVPGDSEWAAAMIKRTRARVARIGCQPGNDWRLTSLRADAKGVAFKVEAPQADFSGEYRVHLLGRHQADADDDTLRQFEPAFADAMRQGLHAASVPKDKASAIVASVVKYLESADTTETTVNAQKLADEKTKLAKNWPAKIFVAAC